MQVQGQPVQLSRTVLKQSEKTKGLGKWLSGTALAWLREVLKYCKNKYLLFVMDLLRFQREAWIFFFLRGTGFEIGSYYAAQDSL